jgi:DNA modification methylase
MGWAKSYENLNFARTQTSKRGPQFSAKPASKGGGQKTTRKNMKIIQVEIEKLIPYARNSRTHSDDQVAQIAASIKEFGWTNPILVDGENGIIAGHGRLAAARKLGMKKIPVIELAHLTETQKRALVIADNKLALNAGWDNQTLLAELEALKLEGFDLRITGFSEDEIFSLEPKEVKGLVDENDVPETPEIPKSILGDIYQLGDHRLMCGDSTNIGSIEELMQGVKCDMVWTDPPYNVAIDGAAGKIMNDDMSDSSFKDFLTSIYSCYYLSMKNGAVIYVAYADTETVNFTQCFKESGLKLSQVLIWAKQAGTLSRKDFNWQHEPILYGWKEGAAHYFCGDFTRTTVIDDDIDIKKMNKKELEALVNNYRTEQKTTILRENRPSKSDLHPTMKPINLVQRMIEWSSRHGEIVLDLFGGSGSTLIACEKIGRKARLMELDPKYCDVIVKRWEDFTGKKAELVNGRQ